ncbi:unnamed protein product [Thelazia callipaeda]|uniref:SAC3_GANP domain-containing protein n=1 Tax=Thelazia callipaeda TaxID=103827 RepID=A0A0N5D6L5_THECL|nr:unnamed protein product [Thelazia callipaeda]
MASGSLPFSIPESLRQKKTTSPALKSANTTRKQQPYSFTRRSEYTDLDDPLGSSLRTVPYKRAIDSRISSTRYSLTRGARIRKNVSSTQHAANIPHSSADVIMSFGGTKVGKRLTAIPLRGHMRNVLDNKLSGALHPPETTRSRTRELVSEEIGSKLERSSECSKVESIVEKAILPKSAVVRQLKRLVGRICESDYDKYQLLDERDRLMQRGRLKSNDVENASVVQGSCSDMCPEKERYLRIVQKRLTVYECRDDGQIAPELTVKEYSRSAADQDEPLPHELRPADILNRTMNYLIGKIANYVPETDEELAQWYDFLWNRTRAIRKDITQQMMVNETAVNLIEQCVRLHIFASHRLCELNFNDFDQKMNTENLSKSLQSLRYLYDDLAKKGIFYASEAEFRAYEIMLNLSDSNVFRQALTYRREILESSPVRLAIRLFTCLQNHNYVRFFQLLKTDATYLQIDVLVDKLAEEIINEEVARLCELEFVKSMIEALTSELYNNIFEACLKPCCLEVMMGATLLYRHKIAENKVKQNIKQLQSLQDCLNESILQEVTDQLIIDSSRKWITRYRQIHDEELLESIGQSLFTDLITEVISETVQNIGEHKIIEGLDTMKRQLQTISERLDRLWLKQFTDRWKEQVAFKKRRKQEKLDLLATFPVALPARSNLAFRWKGGGLLGQGYVDCAMLVFENEVSDFIEKRRTRLVRAVIAKWRLWTKSQIKKKEYFTITYASSTSLRWKRSSSNSDSDDIRLAVALADVELKRMKPFLTFGDTVCDNQQHLSWCESLEERSSDLLNYFDKETLQKGIELAHRNMQRVGISHTGFSKKETSRSLNSLGDNSCELSGRKRKSKVAVENEACIFPPKRECKSLEILAERLKAFTSELDNTLERAKERNRCYDEIFES